MKIKLLSLRTWDLQRERLNARQRKQASPEKCKKNKAPRKNKHRFPENPIPKGGGLMAGG